MFVSEGEPGYPIIVTDWRLKSDAELDVTEPDQAPHVLEFWKLGRFALGRGYEKCTRIALFDYQAQPSTLDAAEARAALEKFLVFSDDSAVFIIPTPSSTMGAEATHLKGTHCWAALHAPDTLEAMRGCRWSYHNHQVTPLYPIAKRVKELQRWSMVQWMRAWRMPTLRLGVRHYATAPSSLMVEFMKSMEGKPLAVDLEFNPQIDIVTAVGLSDGVSAVSIPWDRYLPRNNEEHEPGLESYEEAEQIRSVLASLLAAPTKKIAHNFVADIPRLTKRGFTVNGELVDTFAAHAIALPELRHGLQHAAASLLPVPPWKSIYKPSRLARGITRDDAEFWIADPIALRDYNCRDAFYTWHLARAVLPHVEMEL